MMQPNQQKAFAQSAFRFVDMASIEAIASEIPSMRAAVTNSSRSRISTIA